jgi:hypothetical protein
MFLSLCRLFEIHIESHLNPGYQLHNLTLCSSRVCSNPVKYFCHHFIRSFMLLMYNKNHPLLRFSCNLSNEMHLPWKTKRI